MGRFFWHPSGEYLCVQVDRHSKSKKTIYTNFEPFRVTAKDVPVEVLEFKDQVHAFAWEPNGCRFVVLHGEPPRIDVSFYTMGAEADKKVGVPLQCEKITTLEKKGVNEVRWSPRGNSLVLAVHVATTTKVPPHQGRRRFHCQKLEDLEGQI